LCYWDDKNTKFIAVLQISLKTGKQWCKKRSTKLYCFYSRWQHCFIGCIVLWSQIRFSSNPAPPKFEFLNSARSGSGQIWKSQIQNNLVLTVVESAGYIPSVFSVSVSSSVWAEVKKQLAIFMNPAADCFSNQVIWRLCINQLCY